MEKNKNKKDNYQEVVTEAINLAKSYQNYVPMTDVMMHTPVLETLYNIRNQIISEIKNKNQLLK